MCVCVTVCGCVYLTSHGQQRECGINESVTRDTQHDGQSTGADILDRRAADFTQQRSTDGDGRTRQRRGSDLQASTRAQTRVSMQLLTVNDVSM